MVAVRQDKASDRMLVLEERNMITFLLYLLDHDGCRKTDLYRYVNGCPRGSEKMAKLEASGLIELEVIHQKAVFVHLTEKGRDVAERLAGIRDVLDGSL